MGLDELVGLEAGAAHQGAVNAVQCGEPRDVVGVYASSIEQGRLAGGLGVPGDLDELVRLEANDLNVPEIIWPIISAATSGVAARPVPMAQTGS